MFFRRIFFAVVESLLNMCTLSINVINDMRTDCFVDCEFVSIQSDKTRPCA